MTIVGLHAAAVDAVASNMMKKPIVIATGRAASLIGNKES